MPAITPPPHLCKLAAVLLLVTTITGGCSPRTADTAAPSLLQARVMVPLPGKQVASAYFELQNPTDESLVLTRVSANIGSSVEIHHTVHQGQQVHMERVERLLVRAGTTISFAPGGYHLMLFGVETLPETTEITLHFAGAQPLTATFEAQRW